MVRRQWGARGVDRDREPHRLWASRRHRHQRLLLENPSDDLRHQPVALFVWMAAIEEQSLSKVWLLLKGGEHVLCNDGRRRAKETLRLRNLRSHR